MLNSNNSIACLLPLAIITVSIKKTTKMSSKIRSSIAVHFLAKPLYIFLNILILLGAHSVISHASVSAESVTKPGIALNETTRVGGNNGEMNDFMPSIANEFLVRMKKNGVDHINLMDFLFCGCIVLLGLELVSDITLRVSGCKYTIPNDVLYCGMCCF